MTTTTTPQRAGVREWLGLAVLALPTLLIAMDFTALHLAVPQLSADLRPTGSQILWIVDIYGFMIAGLLIAMGGLGDRIGRRKLLLLGGAAFGAASVLAAFSTSAEMLIAARALLGVTGATLLPSTVALISTMFRDPSQRRFAIAAWATNFMLGGAIGPLVGGLLLESYWWGSVFLIAVPVMLLLVVLGPIVLPEYRSASAGRVDLASIALAMAAILPTVYGIKDLAADGMSPAAAGAIVLGVWLGWLFIRRQRKLTDPMLDLSLFGLRGFSVSLGAQSLGLFVLGAMQFFVMQYLQVGLELTPLQAGLWTIPAMVAGILGNLVIPALARRVRPASLIAGGFAVGFAGAALVATGGGLGTTVVGFSMLTLALNPVLVLTYDIIIGSVPAERAGTASGTAETGSELGLALGVAVAGSIGAAVYRGNMTADDLPADIPAAAVDVARNTVGGAVDAAAELPARLGEPLLAAAQDAFSSGLQVVSVVLAVISAAVGITVAVLLRERPEPPVDQPENCPDDLVGVAV